MDNAPTGHGHAHRRWPHHIGMIEIVVRVEVGVGQHRPAARCDGRAAHHDLGLHGLVGVRVHHGECELLSGERRRAI